MAEPLPYEYKAFARPLFEEARLDWPTMERQIETESHWRHYRSDGVTILTSPTGSAGICQFNPKFYPREIWSDPWASLRYFPQVMRSYLNQFGSYRKALAAYNWGPSNVKGYTNHEGVHPAWDGTREWRCPVKGQYCGVAQMHHYLDETLGPGWPEPGPPPPPEKPVDQFSVGEGLRALMTQYGDTPATDELYFKNPDGKDQFSYAIGRSGRWYTYVFSTNTSFVHEPLNPAAGGDIGTTEIIDLRGDLPVRAGYDKRYPYPPRDLSKVTSVTIHYTAGPASQLFLDIANYQIGPAAQEQFPAIAYHLGVDEVGDVHYLQDLDRRVWHSGAPGANDTSVGIVFTGLGAPNEAQLVGIRNAILWCQEQLGRDLEVFGHKDKYATQCPGPQWPSWKVRILP